VENIKNFLEKGYVQVGKEVPDIDGFYDVLIRKKISKPFIKRVMLFYGGKFQRVNAGYIVAWKPRKLKKTKGKK
jgi:hypothetical protein